MNAIVLLSIVLHLTLDSCLTAADQNQTDLRNAELELTVARAQQGEALAAYFPTISLNAMGYYASRALINLGIGDLLGSAGLADELINFVNSKAGEFNIDPVYHGFRRGVTVGVTLTQPLYAGGRIVTANRMARLGHDAALEKQRLTRRTTRQEIENAFWQIVALDQKQATLRQLSQTLDTAARDLTAARRAGLAIDNDLMQLRLQQGRLSAGMLELEQGLRLAKMNLLNEIGIPYTLLASDTRLPHIDSVLLTPPDDILPDFSADDDYAIDSLPEARLMEISVRAKELGKRMATGEALPEVALVGTYRYINMNEAGQDNAIAAVTVNVPITDWGRIARQRQRIEARAEIERNNRQHVLSQLRLQLQQLRMNITTTARALTIAEQNLALARQTYQNQQANYRAGLITMTDLMQAQAAVVEATEQRTEAFINHRRALTDYRARQQAGQ